MVRRIVQVLEPYAFDRIHAGWWDATLQADAKVVLHRDADRYVAWLRGEVPED
jgi:hypothetical protein